MTNLNQDGKKKKNTKKIDTEITKTKKTIIINNNKNNNNLNSISDKNNLMEMMDLLLESSMNKEFLWIKST
jgi:hypothetical protein